MLPPGRPSAPSSDWGARGAGEVRSKETSSRKDAAW